MVVFIKYCSSEAVTPFCVHQCKPQATHSIISVALLGVRMCLKLFKQVLMQEEYIVVFITCIQLMISRIWRVYAPPFKIPRK